MTHAPLFILTGPSGAGKSTVLDHVLEHPELGLTRFITTTTREPRPGEKNGVDYWFTTREAFERDITDGHFFEWADVYGNYYGSNRRELLRLRDQGGPMVMIADVQGAKTISDAVPEAYVVFIDAPLTQLVERISARDIDPQELKRRIAKIEQEQAFRDKADVPLLNRNGHLEETVAEVVNVVKNHLKEAATS